ncbi:hypothetical protein [Aeromicrobium sp.]|uniref:hypothetical protein n=1 Tax=Aeromicrobium sp. TaxID=1871063 RepID=UPI0028AF73FC|nr:hypothetical protein [Aeromicrobium sp.]
MKAVHALTVTVSTTSERSRAVWTELLIGAAGGLAATVFNQLISTYRESRDSSNAALDALYGYADTVKAHAIWIEERHSIQFGTIEDSTLAAIAEARRAALPYVSWLQPDDRSKLLSLARPDVYRDVATDDPNRAADQWWTHADEISKAVDRARRPKRAVPWRSRHFAKA